MVEIPEHLRKRAEEARAKAEAAKAAQAGAGPAAGEDTLGRSAAGRQQDPAPPAGALQGGQDPGSRRGCGG